MRRAQVIEVLRGALLPLSFVNAAWLGGSDAFGRPTSCRTSTSRWTWTTATSRPPSARSSRPGRRLPDRGPAGDADADLARHAQRFYRLRDTAEFTAVDVVVFQRSDPRRYYSQTERHGRPLVLFDRAGVVRPEPLDRAELRATLAREVAGIRSAAVHPAPGGQGRSAGATPWPPSGSGTATCWLPWSPSTGSATPRPGHDFGTRYTQDDLPAQVQETLAELAFVTGLDDIAAKLPARAGCCASCWRSWASQNGERPGAALHRHPLQLGELVDGLAAEAAPSRCPLTPPKGICGSSWTGWSLTWTMPAWSRSARASPGRGRR